MFAKKLFILFSMLIVTMFSTTICYAEGNANRSQIYSYEKSIEVFFAGSLNSENISCKVSNQKAEIVGSGPLEDKGITVRTTLLIDISTSIPSEVHGNIKLFIDSLIKNIAKNEQYKLVTFSDQLNVLQDFSNDRYDLATAADKIEFNGQESKVYDAIFNTIPDIKPIDDSPCYYRTIIVTDGVDDTTSGITKEELYLRLKDETYPIDVVAVSAVKQTELNKDLSALMRISGGKYYNLDAEADASALSESIIVNDIFWVQVNVPENLLDGSERQINIDDGTNSVQFYVKVSLNPNNSSSDKTSTTQDTNTTDSIVSPQPTPTDTHIPFAFIIGGIVIAVVLICIGIGIFVIVRNKKNKSNIKDSRQGDRRDSKTIILPNSTPYISLRNINNADQVWDVELDKEIIIGRDSNCQVCLDDISVSHQQCKIYINTNIAIVENLSKANITQLNGKPLNVPTKLSEGDKLKCGRVILNVESLYAFASPNSILNDLIKEQNYKM